ncbi:MAG: membrane dipeptidase [Chloroflexi bacterium]|nr:membrane dipeptidase [Chloroflexota bacterium]
MTPEQQARAARLHRDSLVVDALNNPFGITDFADIMDYLRRGGVHALHVTMMEMVPQPWSWAVTLQAIATWSGRCHRYPDQVTLATQVQQIRQARAQGQVALVFGLQNTECLERDLSRLDLLYGLGVRIVQLTYNERNLVGDGYLERVDAGLSDFGLQVVRRLNQLRILVDVSHCGPATTLDAVEASSAPVAATHTGAKAIYPHPRNKSDEELKAIAASGGVIGILAYPLFLRQEGEDSIEDVLDHLDHVVELVGADHVGIGHDNFRHGSPQDFRANEAAGIATGMERVARKMPPERMFSRQRWDNRPLLRLRGFEDIAGWPNLTAGLVRRGYNDEEIGKILGENWLRLWGQVWENGTSSEGA